MTRKRKRRSPWLAWFEAWTDGELVGRSKAIAAKCWDCVGHTGREAIRECGMRGKCPLYEYRPYKREDE